MDNDMNICLEVDFEEYDKVNNKLNKLINELKNNNTFNIEFNLNDMTKQLSSVQDQLEKKPLKVNLETEINKSKSIESASRNFEELKKKVQSMYSSMGEISLVTNGTNEIDKFTVKVKQADGIIQNFKYQLNSEDNKYDLVNVKTIDKTIELYEKALQKRQELEHKINSQNGKESSNLKNELYKELNSLQNQEFATKQKLIGANNQENMIYQDRLNLIRQQQNELGKLISKNKSTDGFENTKLLAQRKTLTDNLSMAQDKYNKKLDEERNKINTLARQFKDSMNTKIQSLNNQFGKSVPTKQIEQLQTQLENLNHTSLSELRAQMKDLRNEFGKITNEIKANSMVSGQSGILSQVKSVAGKMAAWTGVAVGFGAVINQLKTGIGTIYKIDKEMIDLQKVTDETRKTYAEFGKQAHQTGLEVGKQSDEVIRATAEWSKAGETFENAQKLAKTTLIGSNVGDASVDDIHKFLIAPLKAWNMEAEESMSVLDKMNNVSNKHAITVRDLGEAYSKASSVLAMAGNNIDQATSLITSAQAKTQLGGAVIGRGLKAISLRITQMKDEHGQTIPKLEEDLNNVGVKLKNTNHELKSTYDIIKDLSNNWDNISKNDQLSLLDKMAGKENANVLAAIITNFKEAENTLTDSMNSAGSAMQEQEKYMESMEYKVNVLKETMNGLYTDLINSEFVKGSIDFGTGIISGLQKITKEFGAMNTVMATVGGGLFLFNKKIKESFQENIAPIKILKTQFEQYNTVLKSKIATTQTEIATNQAAGISTTGLTTKLHGLKAAQIAVKLSSIALQTALSMGIGVAISLAIQGVGKLISYYKDLKHANEEVISSYKENTNANRENMNYVKSIAKEYDELSNKTHLNAEETKKLKDIKQRLGDMFPELVTGMNEETGEMEIQKKSARELLEILKEKQKLDSDKLLSNGSKALKSLQHDLKDSGKEITKLKSELDEINTGKGSQTRMNHRTGEILVNTNNIKALTEKKKELIEQQKIGKNVTKDLTNVEKELNRVENERKQKASELNIAINKQSEAMRKFKPYIDAVINQYEGLNNVQKKMIQSQIKLKPEDILKLEKGDYSSLMTDINSIVKNIEKDPDLKKVKVLMDLKKPDNSKIKEYMDLIFKLSNDYKMKPVDLMKIMPIKIDKNKLNEIAKEYKNELERAMNKAGNQAKGAIGDKLEGIKKLLIDIDVQGKEDVDEATNSVENLEISHKNLQESFNNIMNTMQFYKQLQEEINQGHGLTQQTIQTIIEKHSELIPYINDTTQLYDVLKNKLNELEGTAEDTYYNMILADDRFSQEVYKNGQWLSDMKNKWYDTDLTNWTNLANGKAAVEKKIIQQIAGMWADYYDKQGNLQFKAFAQDNMMSDPVNGRYVMNKESMNAYKKAQGIQNQIQGQFKKLASDMRNVAGSVNFKAVPISKPSRSSGGSGSRKKSGSGSKGSKGKKGKSAEQQAKDRLQKIKDEIDKKLKEYEDKVRLIDSRIKSLQDRKSLSEENSQDRVSLQNQIELYMKQKINVLKQKEAFIRSEMNKHKGTEIFKELNRQLLDTKDNISSLYTEISKAKETMIDDTYNAKLKNINKSIKDIKEQIDIIDSKDTFNKDKLNNMDKLIAKTKEQRNATAGFVQELEKQLKTSKDLATQSALRNSIKKYKEQLHGMNLEVNKLLVSKGQLIKDLTFEAEFIDKYSRRLEQLNNRLKDFEFNLNKIDISIESNKAKGDIHKAFESYEEYLNEMKRKELELKNQSMNLQRNMKDLSEEFSKSFGFD